MKKYTYLLLGIIVAANAVYAQTGNTGLGTSTPGSKLTVNGSFASAYKTVTGNYILTADDFYVVSNSAANSTVTLPAALPVGSGNYKGRMYEIKNTHTTSTLTIEGNGTELIDDVGATGVLSMSVTPGWGVLVVSTGATSGITWEVVSYHRTTPPPDVSPSLSIIGSIPAGTYSTFSTTGTPLTLTSGVYYVAPYNSNIQAANTNATNDYYGFFDVNIVSGSGASGSQVFHWSKLFTNMFTQPGFILRITSATATVRARLSHGNLGTFTTNGSAQFGMFFQKLE